MIGKKPSFVPGKLRKIRDRLLPQKQEEAPVQNRLIAMLEKGLRYSNVQIRTIFEIGANYGQDSVRLARHYGVSPANIYLFEPHPELVEHIKANLKEYNICPYAVSNYEGEATFNVAKLGKGNDGVSSLAQKMLISGSEEFYPVTVPVKKLDTIFDELNIECVDLIKMDVEGFSYEVLEGAGETLNKKVASIQLECEDEEVFKGQKLYPEVERLLTEAGFTLTYLERFVTQNDSVWVNKGYMKKSSEFYTKETS